MNHERNLNFYTVPRSTLVEKEMADHELMLKENVPAFTDISTEVKDLLLQKMLNNTEKRRQQAEDLINTLYRFPENILKSDIVDLSERQRVTSVIQQVDALSFETLQNVDQDTGPYKALKDIFLIRDHHVGEASWVRIPITGRVDGEIGEGSHLIEGFTSCLDAENNPDDYIGKGSDEFFLNRDSAGDIKSYSVKFKGVEHPITPWEYMHTDDLPIIQLFIGRVEEDLGNLVSGESRLNLV